MVHNPTGRLTAALKTVFSAGEADGLARLIQGVGGDGEVAYQAIDLPETERDDIILLAYEERLLIPCASRPGSAWEDRVLSLAPGAVYFMPRVVKALMDSAALSGGLNPDDAVRKALSEAGDEPVAGMLALFKALQPHTVARQIEAGLMAIIHRRTTPGLDLHDTLDQFVLAGMMSPCPSRSIATGLAWYEISPILYW
jgi:hypothetical protein